jgi:N-methylhydantoinase A
MTGAQASSLALSFALRAHASETLALQSALHPSFLSTISSVSIVGCFRATRASPILRKQQNKLSGAVRVGIDTGGTFTDFVYQFARELRVFKIASTPDDPSRAIAAGLERIASEIGSAVNIEVVHGTTVGTNALLQRRGARTALLTTAGFEDVIEIGRQARPELYNLNAVKPSPLVPAELRFGVNERVAANGEILEALDEHEIEAIVSTIRKAECESIAVSLLFSFVHPEHEQKLARRLAALNLPLSISHEILPEYREYERSSTVVVNAYLQPLMGCYLRQLEHRASPQSQSPESKVQSPGFSLRVMQSSGGSISAQVAAREPVRTILSGPAGGVVGALQITRRAGFENIITFDMGGTSTDVALCDRDGMRLTNESIVAGVPVAIPMMDIHTVGAGGGSTARVDEGGSLRVGPESAGADPGPACYGRSVLPTVTDAHVVLGHFPGASLLGGEFKLDEERANRALDQLAAEISKAAQRKVRGVDTARGVLSVVTTNMERALRHISVERGHDPRDFTLIPFGGAGGLHAVELARALRIPRVLLPASPGALSAIGVLTADVVKEQSRTVMIEVDDDSEASLEKAFREMEKQARTTLQREGFTGRKQKHERSLAARYKGQSFELQIKQTTGNIEAAFHRAHQVRYGYSQPDNVVEIVSARLRSSGIVNKTKPPVSRKQTKTIARPHDFVDTYFEQKEKTRVAVYRREELQSGSRLRTPCIVTEYSATTLVPGDATVQSDAHGNLIINLV